MSEPTDKIEVVLISGKVRCLYVNDYRVVGSKPYAYENPEYVSFDVPAGEIRGQLKREPRAKS